METLQNLLTIAIEATAIIGFGGIALHAFWSSHCKWMAEYCPTIEPVAVEPVAVEPVAVEPVAVEPAVVEPPTVEPAVVEPVAVEPVVVEPVVEEPATVESAATEPATTEPAAVEPMLSKYEAMNVKRLRQECQIHCIDWKKGGDYGKPMRKNQMIRALIA